MTHAVWALILTAVGFGIVISLIVAFDYSALVGIGETFVLVFLWVWFSLWTSAKEKKEIP